MGTQLTYQGLSRLKLKVSTNHDIYITHLYTVSFQRVLASLFQLRCYLGIKSF